MRRVKKSGSDALTEGRRQETSSALSVYGSSPVRVGTSPFRKLTILFLFCTAAHRSAQACQFNFRFFSSLHQPAALTLRPCCSGSLGLSLFSSHACARPCSRDAGAFGRTTDKDLSFTRPADPSSDCFFSRSLSRTSDTSLQLYLWPRGFFSEIANWT